MTREIDADAARDADTTRLLWPVRAAALLSLPALVAVSCLAGTRGLAVAFFLALGFPVLSALALLAVPERRARAWGLELAVLYAVVGTAVLAVLLLRSPALARLPGPAAAAVWSFPVAQAALLWSARRARRAAAGPAIPTAGRVVLAALAFGGPLLLDSPLLLGAHPHGSWPTAERRARSDVQELIAAQFAHAASADGEFGSIGCLTGREEPQVCSAPSAFLREEMAAAERRGYHFTLHRSASGDPVRTFAYLAVPLSTEDYPGWRRTGRRSFCGDSTGRVCAVLDGSPPVLEAGLCGEGCEAAD